MQAHAEADTRASILLAAERLFADRGFGVSLREIGAAAGQRNHSAVQYHFGTKERLVQALFEYRMAALNAERLRLIAELRAAGRERDPAAIVDAIVAPLAGHVLRDRGTGAYARFLARLMLSGFEYGPLDPAYTEGWTVAAGLLAAACPGVSADRLTILDLHLTSVLARVELLCEDPRFTDEQARAMLAELITTAVAILHAQ